MAHPNEQSIISLRDTKHGIRRHARYKQAKRESHEMNNTTIRRYTTFDDHLVPKPLEINILILLSMLLIKYILHKEKIWQNNQCKLKCVMLYFVFHRSRLGRSSEVQTKTLCRSGMRSPETLRNSSWPANKTIVNKWQTNTKSM